MPASSVVITLNVLASELTDIIAALKSHAEVHEAMAAFADGEEQAENNATAKRLHALAGRLDDVR